MKAQIELKSLVAGVLLGGIITFCVAAANNPPPRGEPEYKVVTENALSGDLERAINRSVKNGWDFVSVTHLNEQWGLAVLKRDRP